MGQVENAGSWVAQPASDRIAPDCAGLNFFEIDRSLQDLLQLYLPPDLRAHMTPHYARLGAIAGRELDAAARLADRHGPRLHARDAYGRNEDWIEFHPAYREMERIGFGEFGIHAMTRRPGVLGWPERVPPVAKYVFQYLFTQSEFGLMCPISVTDTSALLIERYGGSALKEKLLPRMLSQDMREIWMSAQFMTEKTGGSDVSRIELEARFEDGAWRLYGEKWFCSCADGDVALLLARPEGAPGGNGGLALFALPRRLDDGSRNRYRIVRLKDKLGSRSMASGEIVFEGALAWPLGEVGAGPNRGLKQMMDQVNLSRLSHGVRAAGMMRRCVNESLVVARSREAFGGRLIDKPLVRRQLMKLLLPAEQALSVSLYTAIQLAAADAGDRDAAQQLRLLTPLLKFRSIRDNIKVATGAMEMRGGNGYIEEWVNARLVRDAHLGVLWEGTSNINAIDVLRRAVARSSAQRDLGAALQAALEEAVELPDSLRGDLSKATDRAAAFAERVAREDDENRMRQAASGFYHVVSAVLLATEGARLARLGRDARRIVAARMVYDHRLRPQDPLEGAGSDARAIDALLGETPLGLAEAQALAA